VDPGNWLTAVSVNATRDERRRSAGGARPPGRVLCRGPRLSSPGALLEGPQDALRSLPGSVHRPGSFLCAAWDRRRSFPCLFDVTGGASGGGHPMRRDLGGEAPSVPVAAPSMGTPPPPPGNHGVLQGRRAGQELPHPKEELGLLWFRIL
jgi:hypothetical protein